MQKNLNKKKKSLYEKSHSPITNSLFHTVGYKNHSVGYIFHSVGYKNHSVGYIFHSVGYKSRTVKQRIQQDKIEYSQKHLKTISGEIQIISSDFFLLLQVRRLPENHREYLWLQHCLLQ